MRISSNRIIKKITTKINGQSSLFNLRKTPCDSVEFTAKASKAGKKGSFEKIKEFCATFPAAFKIDKQLKQNNEIDVDVFKKMGGSFVDGRAMVGFAPFSSKLVKDVNGQKHVLFYSNGLLRRVEIYNESGVKKIVKKYKYDDKRNLNSVVNYTLEKGAFGLTAFSETSNVKFADKFVEVSTSDFTRTPEGIRRSALTKKDIELETKALLDNALERRGISKEFAPKLEFVDEANNMGGSYKSSSNTLTINIHAYRTGQFELENVVEHEATHFEQALLRASLPLDERNKIIKEALLQRMGKGEPDEVPYSNCIFGTSFIKVPKMSDKMVTEFKEFLCNMPDGRTFEKPDSYTIMEHILLKKENLSETHLEFLNRIKTLISNNPDFVKQYQGAKEATDELICYAMSYFYRFYSISNCACKAGEVLTDLGVENNLKAKKSLLDYIDTAIGNARAQSDIFKDIFLVADKNAFNNYQFSPEEVLAQIKGNNALITFLREKLQKIQADDPMAQAKKINLERAIEKAEKTIEYKTKGKEWYEKIIRLSYNPNDAELEQQVQRIGEELKALEREIYDSEYIVSHVDRIKPRA